MNNKIKLVKYWKFHLKRTDFFLPKGRENGMKYQLRCIPSRNEYSRKTFRIKILCSILLQSFVLPIAIISNQIYCSVYISMKNFFPFPSEVLFKFILLFFFHLFMEIWNCSTCSNVTVVVRYNRWLYKLQSIKYLLINFKVPITLETTIEHRFGACKKKI